MLERSRCRKQQGLERANNEQGETRVPETGIGWLNVNGHNIVVQLVLGEEEITTTLSRNQPQPGKCSTKCKIWFPGEATFRFFVLGIWNVETKPT